ncbi:SoxR reducing system RseC family protein [Alkalimonas amylolytica]|uniref:Positive regulator of sigma(E), RseC/MucC n=1 Tax=Alkalimonas amylolytica TaxID=152573 RepID=A0A1H4E455_ALKAM|nr:SoxR reducing system RseC family protein [Alkalimonas amylolytica]SEA79617.1 positive regulator of sigma(E), RseC/MucC [Alkalimonas amylolytica]
MIEQIATVRKLDLGGVWLETTPVTTCQSCSASEDCGTGIVAKTFTPKRSQFFLVTDSALLPGQKVRIGTTEQRLLLAAFSLYLLPLVFMLLGVAVLSWWLPVIAEWWLIGLALLLLWAGFRLAARLAKGWERDAVLLLEVLPELAVTNQPPAEVAAKIT